MKNALCKVAAIVLLLSLLSFVNHAWAASEQQKWKCPRCGTTTVYTPKSAFDLPPKGECPADERDRRR
jgi:transposase-like protein